MLRGRPIDRRAADDGEHGRGNDRDSDRYLAHCHGSRPISGAMMPSLEPIARFAKMRCGISGSLGKNLHLMVTERLDESTLSSQHPNRRAGWTWGMGATQRRTDVGGGR